MGIDDNDLNVKGVERPERVHNDEHRDAEQKKKKHHHKHDDEAQDHFRELTHAAEIANGALVQRKSPYRFCIYEEGSDLFIDVVLLGPDKKIANIKKKKITHEEFTRLMKDIEEGEGLFFDGVA